MMHPLLSLKSRCIISCVSVRAHFSPRFKWMQIFLWIMLRDIVVWFNFPSQLKLRCEKVQKRLLQTLQQTDRWHSTVLCNFSNLKMIVSISCSTWLHSNGDSAPYWLVLDYTLYQYIPTHLETGMLYSLLQLKEENKKINSIVWL